MPSVDELMSRIDSEFSEMKKRVETNRDEYARAFQGRQQRLELFANALKRLQSIWKPRLEGLAQKFGERVKVTPSITPSAREALFKFNSQLARIELRFSATTDVDVRKLVLSFDLKILPILMEFPRHADVDFPLEKIDEGAVAAWIDDRILDFVRTYVSLHENEYYLKDFMVEDPVAHIRFPKFAAGATLEANGKTIYFIGEETRVEYQKQQR